MVDVDDPRVRIPAYRTLRNLSLVCKEWRSIIHETPAFWTMISGTEPLPVLDVILPRTKGAQLIIKDPTINWQCIPLPNALKLFSELHRTSTIWCSIEGADWPAMEPLFRVDPPALETFKFDIRCPYAKPVTLPDDLFGGKRPVSLRYLSLVGCKIQWDSPIFENLTTLLLNNQDRPPWYQFVKIFTKMSNLQDLTLTHCLPSPVSSSQARLPTLKRLQVNDDMDFCVRFLQGVVCDLEKLSIMVDNHARKDVLPLFERASQLLSRSLHHRPFSQVRISTMGLFEDTVGIEGKVSDPDPTRFTIIVILPFRQELSFLERVIETSVKFLPLDHLPHLICDFRDSMSPSLWTEELSPALPNLQCLTLDTIEAAKGFFNALYLDLVDRMTDPSKAIPFARVSRIVGEWPGDPSTDYRPILQDRQRLGLPISLQSF